MTAYDAVLKVKAIAVSSGMARSPRASPSARQMERRTRTTGRANYLLLVTITATALNQPPIDAVLPQSGGWRPAASSDCTSVASSLSKRACRIAIACCSSDHRRRSLGFRLFKPNELIKRLSDDVSLALSHIFWISHVAAHAFSAVLSGLPIPATHAMRTLTLIHADKKPRDCTKP
jgi:hypothetical protein